MSEKRSNFFDKLRALPRLRTGQIILLGVGLLLSIAAFFFLRNFIACWTLTDIAGMAPATCKTVTGVETGSTPAPGETPVASADTTPTVSIPDVELPAAWDGASRVTILVIGLDYRDWEADEGAPRSDTMIVLTVDPITKAAGMVTIPRDLWVNIPGFGYGKINTAYSLGEGNDLPGGGAGLAMKTVEDVLGVPIQYFAQVDFKTFEDLIDAIGGVKVDVTETIELDPVGEGADHVILQPGMVTLPGDLALAYARNRSTSGNDVDRSHRQVQVIMGMQERITNPAYFPDLIARAPDMYNELSSGVTTNLSGFDDAMKLAMLAAQVNRDDIQLGVIDYSMVLIAKSPDGLDILIPLPDKIRELRDAVFSSSGTLNPMAQGETIALMQVEAARISVLNATGITGMAATTGDYLTGQGMNVVNVGDPQEYPGATTLIVHSGKPYAVKYLVELMGLSSRNIRFRFDPAATADIEVLIASDWASSNPMP